MKRWLKNTLICITCLIPLGFVVGFSTNWSHKTTITSVGSSGVKPFIEELAKDYLKTEGKDNIDITVDAGGSGFGIEQVAKGFTNIGNASKNPFSSVDDEKNGLKDKWIDSKIKTYTVAWEAICLVYIPPKGVPVDALLPEGDNQALLSVSNTTIGNLYQAFSGFAEGDYVNKFPSLGDFVSDEYKERSDIKAILDKTKMVPYVRTGGSLTSGTAASFYDYSRFDKPHDNLSDKTQQAFEVGNYGSDWKLIQTDEANSRAWDMFSKSNIPGSVVYLSSGFIAQNYKLIKDSGYGIFGYKNKDNDTTYSYTIGNVQDSNYDWCRPLNLMTSLDQNQGELEFIEDYLLSDETHDLWNQMGAAYLSPNQKKSMMFSSNEGDLSYRISDYHLMNLRGEKDKQTFGAIYE